MQDDSNGYSPGMYDQDLINAMGDRIGALTVRRDELKAEIVEVDAAIKRYERSIAALDATPKEKKEWSKGPKSRTKQQRESARRSMRESERWPRIKDAIIAYARDHEEFTQSEFRNAFPDLNLTSGHSSIAFGIMHDDKELRISRVDGNSKYYRLVKEAVDAR